MKKAGASLHIWFFLWFAGEPWVRKLIRIKKKFGMDGEEQNYVMPPAGIES